MVFAFRLFCGKRGSNVSKELIKLFRNNLYSYLGFVDDQAIRKIVFWDFGFTNYVFEYFSRARNVALRFLFLKVRIFFIYF